MKLRPGRPAEILVALGSVAVLSAMVSPLFAPARPRLCFDNMRRIGSALAMYTDLNDHRYPRGYEYRSMPNGRERRINWSARLKPYLPTMDVFRCPADPERMSLPKHGRLPDLQAPVQSYLPNYAVLPAHQLYLRSVSTDEIADRAALVVFAERQAKLGSRALKAYAGVSGFVPDSPAPGEAYRRVTLAELKGALAARSDRTIKLARVAWRRHDGLSNFAFADGHVRALPAAATLDPQRPVWGERFYPSDGRSP